MASDDADQQSIDALFELPPAQFTAARNGLAKELAKSGRKDLAAQVKALTRPSAAVWVINQLARREPARLGELAQVDAQLRATHGSALHGHGVGEMLRTLSAQRRDQIGQLVALARDLLAIAGMAATPVTLQRVDDTLSAAATDADLARMINQGRLDREAEPGVFTAVLPVAAASLFPAAVPPAPQNSTRASDPAATAIAGQAPGEGEAERERLRRERELVEQQQRERLRVAQQARETAAHLRRLAEEAAARTVKLEAEARQLEDQAGDMRARARRAAEEAAEAKRQADDAQQRADELNTEP